MKYGVSKKCTQVARRHDKKSYYLKQVSVKGLKVSHFNFLKIASLNGWRNPITTDTVQNQPIYEYHVTAAGRKRVKSCVERPPMSE